MVDMMTLAHLHTSRAVIPTQTNVIEAGPGMKAIQQKEWYYNTEEGRQGPVSFEQVCTLYLYFISFCKLFILVERIVSKERDKSQNTLLGHGSGWLEAIKHVAPIEVVFTVSRYTRFK